MMHVVCFVAYFSLFFSFVFVSSFHGLACFVAGTLAFHLLYLEELQLFGLFRLTVCDRHPSISSISNLFLFLFFYPPALSRMKGQHDRRRHGTTWTNCHFPPCYCGQQMQCPVPVPPLLSLPLQQEADTIPKRHQTSGLIQEGFPDSCILYVTYNM